MAKIVSSDYDRWTATLVKVGISECGNQCGNTISGTVTVVCARDSGREVGKLQKMHHSRKTN